MDNKNNLTEYLSEVYPRWVGYAQRYIRRSRLPINPSELVNEVVCSLLERDRERMERLVNSVAGNTTELDLFVMGVIKNNIYSPHAAFRYQRGQAHKRIPIESANINIAEDDDLVTEVRNAAHQVLCELNADDLDKKVFAWKFFDGNPISKWPGIESKRILYYTYARILKRVAKGVKIKITD